MNSAIKKSFLSKRIFKDIFFKYSNSKIINYRGWTITETACFPCCWKIEKKGYKTDNAIWRFHKTVDDAKKTIDKLEFGRDE